MNELLTKALKPRDVRFWGSDYHVVPALVEHVWGDGAQLLQLFPLSQRPHHYLVRFDSKTDVGSDNFLDLLDEIEDTIEEEFGEKEWANNEGNPLEDEDILPFPAADFGCGVSWNLLSK